MRVSNFQSKFTQTDLTFTPGATIQGQLIADAQEVEILGSVPPQGLRGTINSVVLLAKDGVSTKVDVVFKTTSTSMGTEGGAVSIADSDAQNILGVTTTRLFRPLSDSVTPEVTMEPPDNPIPFNLSTGSIYVALIEAEAASFRSAGISIRLGVVINNVAVA